MRLEACVPTCTEQRQLTGLDGEGDKRRLDGRALQFRFLTSGQVFWIDLAGGQFYDSLTCE